MNTCEQAEAFRLLLLMGVASKAEFIAWADDLIAREERPQEWLLDLSLAANDGDDVIESRLRDLPCDGNRAAAAYAAVQRFADVFRSGEMPPMRAALILQRWAVSASVSHEDWKRASMPLWVAAEVEHGYTSEEDVVEALGEAFAYFGPRRFTSVGST